MKNILKLTTLVLLTLVFGCNSDDDNSRFKSDPNSGWIEFQTTETLGSPSFSNTLDIPIIMSVPLNTTDLKISYDLMSVSGANVNTIFNQNSLIVPANTGGVAMVGGSPKISFDLQAAANITEAMVFDIVLTSTNRNSVSIGIDGTDRPTTHRVSICPSYNTDSGNFLGDYTLTVPTGAGPFGAQFADGTVVTLVQGSNGSLSRVFGIDYLPGVAAGDPITNINFTFTSEGVMVADAITTGVGCGSTFGGIVFGNHTDNAAPVPCGDDTITLNILDFKFIGDPDVAGDDAGTGGCGEQDVETTILLTKI